MDRSQRVATQTLQPRPCAQWHSHSWLCACGVRAVHLPPPSPLRGMKLCVIGFSLCVFPVGGSPGFQSGGARLQACGKSANTRRASESVWQLPFRVRARFQPCRNCRQINKASAAEGLAFQLPRRLFTPGPAPSGTVYSSPTIARFLRDDSCLCACGVRAVRLPPSSPLFVFPPLVYPACPELVCRRQASRGAKSKGHCSSFSRHSPLPFTIDGRLLAFGANL